MKRARRCTGIVVRRSEFSESSRIVTLITREHGRLPFLAKGAHRPKSPFLGAIDLFHVVEARVHISERRGLQLCYGMEVLQGNRPFRADLVRYGLACHWSELLRIALPEGRPDPALFELFRSHLRWLGVAKSGRLLALDAAFRIRFLEILGAWPEPGRCPQSGRELPRRGDVGFVPGQGGFVVRESAGRRVPARLPWLASEIGGLDAGELLRLDPPADALRALHPLLCELVAHELEQEVRVPIPSGLFRRHASPARIRS